MSVLAKIKKLVPKTPKGWILAGTGVGAAGLAANYVIAGPEHSVIGRLLHALHGGGGGAAPHPHGGHAPAAAPHPMMQVPMMVQQPPMVFVEPTMASNFGYRFKHHHGYGEHPYPYAHAQPMHPQPMHPQYPQHPHVVHAQHPHFDFHAEHQAMPHMAAPQMHVPPHHAHHRQHPHHVDPYAQYAQQMQPPMPMQPHDGHYVAGVTSAPHNPEESRMHVYAPGAKGIAAEPTTQAAGIVDPRAVTANDYSWES